MASATFTISGSSSLSAPVISPDGGSYTTAQSVTISNVPSGDTAYYTTDGTSPETSGTRITISNGATFTVSQSETVQAIYSDPTTGWSSVASATFTISGSSSLYAPVISPDGGSYTTAQSVTISNVPSGDTAYYTTDGTDPETSGTRIAISNGATFTVSQSETVQAIYSDPTTGWSSVASATFTIGASGSNSDQITELQQEFDTAMSNNQFQQAAQILQQIEQLSSSQNQTADLLNSLKQQIITAVDNGNYAQAEAFLKQIIKLEQASWAYTQLGQIYQQQGNSNVSVFTNGNELNSDVQPTIVNNRVMVPIRSIADSLGVSDNNVQWNTDGTVTITDGSNQILLRNNSQQMYRNGTSYTTDVAPRIVNGRMMVPLRAVSQLFNKNVQWYSTGRIVSIS